MYIYTHIYIYIYTCKYPCAKLQLYTTEVTVSLSLAVQLQRESHRTGKAKAMNVLVFWHRNGRHRLLALSILMLCTGFGRHYRLPKGVGNQNPSCQLSNTS